LSPHDHGHEPGPVPGTAADDPAKPTFSEPWEAEALALSMALKDQGYCTAEEWARTLGAEIESARGRGDLVDGTTYYAHVLAAVERLVCDKGLADRTALHDRRRDWEDAYLTTPHGQPVALPDAKRS
jgi:nitrile hydratase accessory protein